MRPAVIWFTGLSGAGKTTLAAELRDALKSRGERCELLDGDEIRRHFPAVGFSKEDRDAHVRRVGFVASLLQRNGVFAVAALVSPYREARDAVRGMVESFVEVHVSTPLAECERRDSKGHYRAARAGKLQAFTGVSDPYEAPLHPELSLDTTALSAAECLREILEYLERRLR